MQKKKKQKVNWKEVASKLWEHYRNYIDSLAESDDQGDVDELQELIEIASEYSSIEPSEDTKWKNVSDMIPVLLSVSYFHLADAQISEYLATDGGGGKEQALEIQSLISKSLEYYPLNSVSWSMGANFGRVTQRLPFMSTIEWYEQALEPLARIKKNAFELLEDDDVDSMVKEWVELLVLNQVLGIVFEEVGGEENEKESDDNDEEDLGEKEDEDEESNEEEDGQYSASSVEGTARFMSATLWSMKHQHDRALAHLKKFHLTHRLHPNVWKISTDQPKDGDENPTKAPLAFRPSNGILPASLYESMMKIFAPKSNYWNESDYSNRGYYSYFTKYEKNQRPKNLIEEVIINHLLPRAKQVLDEEEASSICGFEWWVHTRPVEANLGHNLHFDTDESMLAQEKKVTHPILSSVLYLTGGKNEAGGATIVLNQTPDSESAPEYCWQATPKDNTFLIFPGELLHGVLPCPGQNDSMEIPTKVKTRNELISSWVESPVTDKSAEPHRLTFMVGFWTRDVPSTMENRKLYGPCGPLPPSTEEHSWVGEIHEGYSDPTERTLSPVAEASMKTVALPKVSPVWEEFEAEDDENEPELQIPRAIDHRFFVRDVPRCFRNSLFEDDEGEC